MKDPYKIFLEKHICDSHICPLCSSEEINATILGFDEQKEKINVKVDCLHCKHTYTDIYTITDIII